MRQWNQTIGNVNVQFEQHLDQEDDNYLFSFFATEGDNRQLVGHVYKDEIVLSQINVSIKEDAIKFVEFFATVTQIINATIPTFVKYIEKKEDKRKAAHKKYQEKY